MSPKPMVMCGIIAPGRNVSPPIPRRKQRRRPISGTPGQRRVAHTNGTVPGSPVNTPRPVVHALNRGVRQASRRSARFGQLQIVSSAIWWEKCANASGRHRAHRTRSPVRPTGFSPAARVPVQQRRDTVHNSCTLSRSMSCLRKISRNPRVLRKIDEVFNSVNGCKKFSPYIYTPI
jgi:hypothetical protein